MAALLGWGKLRDQHQDTAVWDNGAVFPPLLKPALEAAQTSCWQRSCTFPSTPPPLCTLQLASSIFRPYKPSPLRDPLPQCRDKGPGTACSCRASPPPWPLLCHRSKNYILLQQPAERRKRRRRKRLWPSQGRSFLVYKPSFCLGRNKTMSVELRPQAKLVCSLTESPGEGKCCFTAL